MTSSSSSASSSTSSSRITRSVNPVLAPVSAVTWQPMDPATRLETGLLAAGTAQQQRNTLSMYQYSPYTPHLTRAASIQHTGDVTALEWVGSDIITSNDKGSVYVYRVGTADTEMKSSVPPSSSFTSKSTHTLHLTHTFPLHAGSCTALGVSPSPTHPILATSGEDGGLHTISLATHTITRSIRHANTSSTLCLAWNGMATLVCGGMGGRLLSWDFRVGEDTPTGVAQDANSLALSCVSIHPTRPDTVATGSTNGILSLWDIRRGATPMCAVQAHTGPIWDVAFAPSQPTTILTCGEDGAVASWDFNPHGVDASRITYSTVSESDIVATRIFECDTSTNSMSISGDGVICVGSDSEQIVFLDHAIS